MHHHDHVVDIIDMENPEMARDPEKGPVATRGGYQYR